MATVSLPAVEARELEALSDLEAGLTIREAVPLLIRLTSDPTFLEAHVMSLQEEARGAKEWYVAHTCEGKDGSYSLQVFIWPPRTRTQIHDHTSWGAYCCAVGSVFEERYERLDDGLRPDHARLKKVWQLSWSPEDGVSSVLLYDEGMHRVGNPWVA
jgi:predicted metal-dependent enzyme (double-stranded beta helix superfamily)